MAPLLRRQCEQGQQRQQGGWGRAAAQAAAAAGVLGLGLGAAALMEEGDQLEVGRWGRVWGRSMHCSIRMDATDTANQSARCANQTHAVDNPQSIDGTVPSVHQLMEVKTFDAGGDSPLLMRILMADQ